MGDRVGICTALAACLVAFACSSREAELRAANERLQAELEQLRAAAARQGVQGADASAASATARSRASASEPNSAPSVEELREQVSELRVQLAREQSLRLEREREWLRYTSAFEALSAEAVAQAPHFEPQVPAEELPAPTPPSPPIDEARAERARSLARSLRTLLSVEGVRGFDLLEAGELGDGWIGPVVFRLLDERGRLAGSLGAQRLRLLGSRTARTLTIVLEEGFESRGGVRTAFEPEELPESERESFGVRRIELEEVDPMPWISAAPELFGGAQLAAPVDDGHWNLTYVRASLNRLLRLDIERGYWRLKTLGGVAEGVLHDVHFEQFDAQGQLERRLFADRLRIERRERGVALLLEDGATVRGDEKSPFLDGHFRIYLPRAEHAEWNSAGLPGLSATPSAAARGAEPEPDRD